MKDVIDVLYFYRFENYSKGKLCLQCWLVIILRSRSHLVVFDQHVQTRFVEKIQQNYVFVKYLVYLDTVPQSPSLAGLQLLSETVKSVFISET